jgi:hypothetical protein
MGKQRAGKFVFLCICSALLLACAGCSDKGASDANEVNSEVDQKQQSGPLTVHLRLDRSTITIAETVQLELEATTEPGYEVQMPKVDKVLENFGILDWDNLGDKLDQDNKLARTYRYRLEPFLSGTYEIPAFTFVFHDVNDVETKHELSTESVEVEVTSLLGEQRENLVIADIEGPVEIPQKASRWWAWVLILAAAAAAGIYLWRRRTRKVKLIRIFKPAHEIAYARLKALIDDDLVNAGGIKEFYERLSSILRHYIEDRYDLRAPERTTEEFLTELRHTEVLSPDNKKHLGDFLTHCDLVKFARHSPTKEQIQKTFDLAKNFIERTKSDERKIDVTDRLGAEETVKVRAG